MGSSKSEKLIFHYTLHEDIDLIQIKRDGPTIIFCPVLTKTNSATLLEVA